MRKLKIIIVMLSMGALLILPAIAYTDNYPTNAPFQGGVYIHCTTSLGQTIVYIPVDYKEGYISTYKGNQKIVNIGSTTINCNIYTGNNYQTYYAGRLTRGSYLEYQNNSSTWVDVNVSAILNTNVQIIDNFGETAIRQITIEKIIDVGMFAVLLILTVIIILKRN